MSNREPDSTDFLKNWHNDYVRPFLKEESSDKKLETKSDEPENIKN